MVSGSLKQPKLSKNVFQIWEFHRISAERLELSDTMHVTPMQTGQPNGVRSSDWLADFI